MVNYKVNSTVLSSWAVHFPSPWIKHLNMSHLQIFGYLTVIFLLESLVFRLSSETDNLRNWLFYDIFLEYVFVSGLS